MKIVLIGYRCSGKSTIGKRLADHLNLGFIDTDELIEKRNKSSINEIVKSYGWSHFRAEEKKVIKEVSKMDHLVIASGGGALLDQENMMSLRKRGLMIWLKASLDVILKRMSNDPKTNYQRPSLTGKGSIEEIEQELSIREPLYEMASDIQVDTSALSIEEVLEEILFLLRRRIQVF